MSQVREFVGVFKCNKTNLAEISTTSSLSSKLRKVFLGVKVTLKAGSTKKETLQ